MFNCDSGTLKSSSIGPGSLMDLADDPSGKGQRVRVNSKGQIVEIISELEYTSPRSSLAYFTGASPGIGTNAVAYIDDNEKNATVGPDKGVPYGGTTDNQTLFKFIVPEFVTRINAILVEGGGRYIASGQAGYTAGDGHTGGYSETVLLVRPFETLQIVVGDGAAHNSAYQINDVGGTFIETQTQGTFRAGTSATDKTSSVLHKVKTNASPGLGYIRPYLPYGQGGTSGSQSGRGGLVILEWYA